MLPEVPDRLQDCLQPLGEHVAGIRPTGRPGPGFRCAARHHAGAPVVIVR